VDDVYTVDADGHAYRWDGSAWVDIGQFKGDHGDPLAPGTLGAGEILSSATGATVSAFKPGRIDARVRGLSTAATASANKTVFDALATEAGAGGHELWIPEGTYNLDDGRVASNSRVAGRGTLQATSGTTPAPLRVLAGLSNIVIDGLSFNGGGVASGVQVGNSSSGTVVTDVTIRNCAFTNTGTTSSFGRAGVSGARSKNLRIEGCRFTSVWRGVDLQNPAYLTVAGNTIDTTTDNAVYVLWDANIHDSGASCMITDNYVRNAGRMGMEFWSSGGTQDVRNAIIARNSIETVGAGSMGISSPTIREAQIIDNVIRSANSTDGNGIEAFTESLMVRGNAIYGFLYGVTLNALVRGQVINNYIEGSDVAIRIVSVSTGVRRATIARNMIYNPINRGVLVASDSTISDNGWHDVIENTVIRDTAYSGDATRTFDAFAIGNQGGFCRFHRNRAVQGQTSPTAGLAYRMFLYTGTAGNLKASEFHGNILEDMSGSLTSTMFDESTAAAASDAELTGNKQISSTGVVTTVSAWS
jgi:hypothetical protein